MSDIRLIGISGLAGSGKDTVAQIIKDVVNTRNIVLSTRSMGRTIDFDYLWQIHRFSGKLKEVSGVLLNVPAEKFEDREYKESYLPDFDMTVRDFLRFLGTECLRQNLHKDIWINSLFREYKYFNRWLIPDMRFINEGHKIKELGGILIRVDRPSLSEDHHISEQEWRNLPFDYVLENSGDLVELNNKVIGLIKEIGL